MHGPRQSSAGVMVTSVAHLICAAYIRSSKVTPFVVVCSGIAYLKAYLFTHLLSVTSN
ncbi:hypothetical protein EDB85DRAFT_2049831 [Lactarius pseudohatsudake]|nr:hypothetical protein EDB85DRAFT_2049831 [Lactarius pseudohatsudake]